MYANWLSGSNNFVSNHRIFRCENVVKQTMCLITCNALVRVSRRMLSFSELLQQFNFQGSVYWQGEVLVSHDEIVTCCVDQERADVCKSESPLKERFQQSSFVREAHLSPGQT